MMQSLVQELKRRHVVRVALVYAAVAFAVVQAADLAFPRLGLPDWTVTFVLVLALLGLPLALVLAWMFDVTPAGLVLADQAQPVDESGSAREVGGPAPIRAARGRTVWVRVAQGVPLAIVVVAVAAALAMRGAERPVTAAVALPVMRLPVPLPDTVQGSVAQLAPDGSALYLNTAQGLLVYHFADMAISQIHLPGFNIWDTVRLSPDGTQFIHLPRLGGTLRVITLAGGAERSVLDSVHAVDWGDDGTLYVVTRHGQEQRVMNVRADGTGRRELGRLDDEDRSYTIVALPGGRGLIYVLRHPQTERFEVRVMDTRTGRHRPLPGLQGGAGVLVVEQYLPTGHLLMTGSDGVYVVPFDLRGMAVTGAPVRVLRGQPLSVTYAAGVLGVVDVSPAGLVVADLKGGRQALPGAHVSDTWGFGPTLSPDEGTVAFFRYHAAPHRWDVWTHELAGGRVTRLTPDSLKAAFSVEWSGDGRTLHFLAKAGGTTAAYAIRADGSGSLVRLLDEVPGTSGALLSLRLLQDGRQALAVAEESGLALVDLRAGTALTLVEARFRPTDVRVSHDERWVAYASTEAGEREVFIRPLDGSSDRWRVARPGARRPVWSRTGSSIFVEMGDSIHAVPLHFGSDGIQAAGSRPVFPVESVWGNEYEALPGDSLFLLMAAETTGRLTPATVIINFDELVRRLTRR
jgi:hypothetical protein